MNNLNSVTFKVILLIFFTFSSLYLYSQQGPVYNGNNFSFETTDCGNLDLWLSSELYDIESMVSTDCNNGSSTLSIDFDCDPCSISCTEMKTIVMTVTDDCALSNQYSFDFFANGTPPSTEPYFSTPQGDLSVERTYCEGVDTWITESLAQYKSNLTSDCNNGIGVITASYDCSPCTIACNETKIVVATYTDECAESSQFTFTFYAHDGDGVDPIIDNCPDKYNPGQEDIDNDGFGNVCDPVNQPGESVEIENNMFLNATSSGVIMKSPDGNCWFLTIDNSGQSRTYSVECPTN